MGLKMCSKNIFFTLGFWVELPQILGLGFSMRGHANALLPVSVQLPASQDTEPQVAKPLLHLTTEFKSVRLECARTSLLRVEISQRAMIQPSSCPEKGRAHKGLA